MIPNVSADAARGAAESRAEAALMARNGIVRVPADQYHVDGYRYASLADALAQVRRRSAEDRAS